MSNYHLTVAAKRRLLKSLPAIGESFFNDTMHKSEFCDGRDFGICFNNQKTYQRLGIDENYGYPDISNLLYHDLKFPQKISLEGSYPCRDNWENRAWMCLFMAEYLKGI